MRVLEGPPDGIFGKGVEGRAMRVWGQARGVEGVSRGRAGTAPTVRGYLAGVGQGGTGPSLGIDTGVSVLTGNDDRGPVVVAMDTGVAMDAGMCCEC